MGKKYASLTSSAGEIPTLNLRHVPESFPIKYSIQGMEGEVIEYLTLTISF